ncbi:carboxyl transferase domain-containing protein [Streptomyces sp. ODS28]|uniref:acetyl-CoA carboxylase family protein n=1 Tax=Streptomyces sp. ODS28 TaxID=3136688 RepID=UPI0031F13C2F
MQEQQVRSERGDPHGAAPRGVLIANRGEIALRIHRAAAELGLRTVAAYTPEDREAPHIRLASQAELLKHGDAEGADGYLDGAQLVDIARRTGCALVHPGYGFLSENAEFAAACEEAGLAFAGPPPELLRLLGDKSRARAAAAEHGLPVLPATPGAATLDEARDFLRAQGPGAAVMVKALHGGGGRGMRAVYGADELATAYERCRSEARRAFGDGSLGVERLVPRARHLEVQIIGDGTGEAAQLGDRDCSVQRRHQKLIETAPAPALPDGVRERMADCALRLARGLRYRGLGTVEFLLDLDAREGEELFFIEVNPRLQVEHTVTEEVTGIDLVAAQLRLAQGESLADQGLTQDRVPAPRGCAVQARVNLERTGRDGVPRATSGTLTAFQPPTGPGIRVDTHGTAGARTTERYDSLLAKVVAHTPRGGLDAAAARLERALDEFTVQGPECNTGLLRAVLAHPDFVRGACTTRFLDRHLAELLPEAERPPEAGDHEHADDPGDPDGAATVRAPSAGTVIAIEAAPGETVPAGGPVLVLEAMKMEHVLEAPAPGTVREIHVIPGDTVGEGDPLATLVPSRDAAEGAAHDAGPDPDAIRPDLAEALRRHAATRDEARPEAVARRHARGKRTARENVEALCDPGTFTEYGALTVAGQRKRRSLDDLIASTPADGMVTGLGAIGGRQCAVLAYDYTVLAGTQGVLNHAKTDRMLEIALRRRLPVVLFAEGGGGRPGDTDLGAGETAGLSVHTFGALARLNGLVPTVGIASGRCFAGNAALLGCCDAVIATEDACIGMGGPAMIEGGGLGRYLPEEIGPVSDQAPNGVIDLVTADETEAAEAARRYLAYFRGHLSQDEPWEAPDPRLLRHVVPENRVRAYDIRRAVHGLADTGSVMELRRDFGAGVITALARVEGRPLGLFANNPAHLGGAIDSDAADKAARFLQLCEAHRLPVLSLIDTPGFMVGPDSEKTATVRHFGRLFVGGARLTVPLCAVVLRKAYGLGAMAMAGGGLRTPAATVAWPTGELGPMGLEGAVRLGFRRELEAIADPAERQRAYDELLDAAYERGRALSAATVFDVDDVIDPADTRRWITASLMSAEAPEPPHTPRPFIDTW